MVVKTRFNEIEKKPETEKRQTLKFGHFFVGREKKQHK